jgi:Ca2+-binding EF-hand superfamily protein
MIYTKFKALSKISKVKYPEIVKDVGVEKSIFTTCLQEENVNNAEFLEKIFDVIDRKGKSYLNWDEFFQALKLVSSRDLKDKIDLFFYIVDSDGNGLFSYDEIRDICQLSFSKFENSPDYEEFREEISDFFASYIFKLLDKDPETDEIPVSEFKNAIFHGTNE